MTMLTAIFRSPGGDLLASIQRKERTAQVADWVSSQRLIQEFGRPEEGEDSTRKSTVIFPSRSLATRRRLRSQTYDQQEISRSFSIMHTLCYTTKNEWSDCYANCRVGIWTLSQFRRHGDLSERKHGTQNGDMHGLEVVVAVVRVGSEFFYIDGGPIQSSGQLPSAFVLWM